QPRRLDVGRCLRTAHVRSSALAACEPYPCVVPPPGGERFRHWTSTQGKRAEEAVMISLTKNTAKKQMPTPSRWPALRWLSLPDLAHASPARQLSQCLVAPGTPPTWPRHNLGG